MYRLIILLCTFFTCCSTEPPTSGNVTTISGREPERFPLYRVSIPDGWEIIHPDPDIALTDSRLALLECRSGDSLRVVFHNFPSADLTQRIPPQAQVERWKKQLDQIQTASVITTPQSFSGYTGLLLQAEGKDTAVMGWALQIGADHYRNFSYSDLPEQMRADITIKATGTPLEIARNRAKLQSMARSFELIEEIPVSR